MPATAWRRVADILDDTVYLSFPITKFEETPSGHLLVHGCATDGSIDSDEQIVDADWSGKAVEEWLKTGGNVRVMHNAQRDPAGVGVEVDLDRDGSGQHWVKSLVVEPTAKELVRSKALRAYSVGISKPRIVRDVKARNGRIVGGEISEISLVDRPANKSCGITLVKADSDGNAEVIGKVFGAETLNKVADPLGKSAMPENVDDDADDDEKLKAAEPDDDGDTGENDGDDDDTVEKAKYNAEQLRQMLKEGKAMRNPAGDPSYPIGDKEDLGNAIHAIGRGSGSHDAIRAHIKRRASALGLTEMLPESWSKKTDEPDVEKGGMDCPKCGKGYDADTKATNCESCGAKLSKAADVEAEKMIDRVLCDECGASVDGDVNFCPVCGDPKTGKASKTAKPVCTKCGMKVKRNAAFCSNCGEKVTVDKGKPTIGDGHGHQSKPVPEHREPDGVQMESFEDDAGMQESDAEAEAERAAARHKTSGAGEAIGKLHDLLCCTVPGDATAIPAAINVGAWAEKAVAATTAGDLDRAGEMLVVMGAAKTLKDMDADTLIAARAELVKEFSTAYPDVKLTPGGIKPGMFERGLITAGHQRPSGGHDQPSEPVSVPTDGIEASDFERGPLTAGHERPSPGNIKDAARPSSSMPARTYYTRAGAAAARNAMESMHDHIARTFPDICPMADTSPSSIKSETETEPDVGVTKTADTVPVTEEITPENVVKAQTGDPDVITKSAALDLVKAHTADLLKSLGDQIGDLRAHFDDQISALRSTVEEMAAEPDPRQAPWRGVAVSANKNATVTPVERRSLVDEAAARSREQLVLDLQNQVRNSTSPAQRENARSALKNLLGA